jgi:hypothetical protein
VAKHVEDDEDFEVQRIDDDGEEQDSLPQVDIEDVTKDIMEFAG